jgi:microcystin-dependent protein
VDQYVGEIRLFSFNFAPKGWSFCAGQLMSIQQNQALFALLGTIYGGNGIQTFGLPDLRGRVANHMGSGGGGNYVIGEFAGTENVSLNANQIPAHLHLFQGTKTAGATENPINRMLGQSLATSADKFAYAAASNLTPLNPASIQPAGGPQPHANIQPYLALNYCISLTGIFPSRN